jgi:hypothetical protein
VRGRWLLAALPLGLAACTAAPQTEGPQPAAPAPIPAPPPPAPPPSVADGDLQGRWRVVALNGAPPVPSAADRGGERSPFLVFSPRSYGGSSGCNSFGGLGVIEGGRLYASGAMRTAIGCGALAAQEEAIIGLRTSSARPTGASRYRPSAGR